MFSRRLFSFPAIFSAIYSPFIILIFNAVHELAVLTATRRENEDQIYLISLRAACIDRFYSLSIFQTEKFRFRPRKRILLLFGYPLAAIGT